VIERQCFIPGQADDCGLNGYECDDGEWRGLMTYCNPPPMEPEPLALPETCAHIRAGAACTDGDSCTIDMPEECSVSGYRCLEGVWEEELPTCNPPPGE
jgi:hypothetical protein